MLSKYVLKAQGFYGCYGSLHEAINAKKVLTKVGLPPKLTILPKKKRNLTQPSYVYSQA